ncbi:MAG: hypothetical protein MI725_13260, partial [Pirellulales bacterium]|nr:hypothetical protein [Pirellulales bacterium]
MRNIRDRFQKDEQSLDLMNLKLFPVFELADQGHDAVEVALRRGQALIAYLALKENRTASREMILDMLWPGRFKEQAQASLRQVLFELRKKSTEDLPIVIASRSDVALGPAIDECDVWAFEAATRSGSSDDAELALRLYRGRFLDGPGIQSEPFQQWVAIQQGRLEGELESLVLAAAGELVDQGDNQRACRLLEELIRVSPLCYHAVVLLMQIDVASNLPAEAIRRFERYDQFLKLELDEVAPQELRDAYETLKSAPVKHAKISAQVKREAFAGSDPWRRSSSDAPVIAVLPFRYMADNPVGNQLAVAMSEDITLMLSGCRWFKVMSRSATHGIQQDQSFVINDFARKTGVDYLIYGAVMERGEKWSVTVELAHAGSGFISWAKRYEADDAGILDWANDICPQIVAALDPALTDSEIRLNQKPVLSATGSVAAYHSLVSGYRDFYSGNWSEALSKFGIAVEQDETYAHAHAMMAVTVYLDAQVNRRENWRAQLQESEFRARRALDIDPSEAKACNILGQILDWQGEHGESFQYLQRAVTLNPSFAWASTGHSYHSVMLGKFDEAKDYIQSALRLRVGDSGLGLCLPAKAL